MECEPTSLYPSEHVKFTTPPYVKSDPVRCAFIGRPGSSHLTAWKKYELCILLYYKGAFINYDLGGSGN